MRCYYSVVLLTELLAEAIDVKSSEEKQSETETKPALVDTNEMQRKFKALIDKLQPLLANLDADPTQSVSTSESTSESISINESATEFVNTSESATEVVNTSESATESVNTGESATESVNTSESATESASNIDRASESANIIDRDSDSVSITDIATESVSISQSATDTSVSKCKGYLHLIDFPEEETDSISDPQSLFKLLMPYLDFQRFHILEMIVGQFKSDKAKKKIQNYRKLLSTYQSLNLGKFVLAIAMRSAPLNPPFMRPFSLQLESKWTTCTIQDLETLLNRILPTSVGDTFMWFCKARQVADDNSICLDYIVSPSVVDILKQEAKRKQGILGSAGILRLSIDGTDLKPKVGC